VHSRLEACRTQGAVEEELRARIPHQAVPRQVKIGLDVERFHWIRIVGVGRVEVRAWRLAGGGVAGRGRPRPRVPGLGTRTPSRRGAPSRSRTARGRRRVEQRVRRAAQDVCPAGGKPPRHGARRPHRDWHACRYRDGPRCPAALPGTGSAGPRRATSRAASAHWHERRAKGPGRCAQVPGRRRVDGNACRGLGPSRLSLAKQLEPVPKPDENDALSAKFMLTFEIDSETA
jgi:hypothetical protein